MSLAPWTRTVTLAIDDGPSDATPALLDALEARGHRAVLFVLGCNIAGREATLVGAIRRGFALGNHSFDHPNFSAIGINEARSEIAATERLIDAAYAAANVKRPGKWFRFPYLDTGGAAHYPLQTLLGEFGFGVPRAAGRRRVRSDVSRRDWPTTLSTQDWALPDVAALRATLRQARPGDLIEFHDKPETISRYIGAMVEELAAQRLRATVPGQHLAIWR
jgi:peptidoglycan/xylan/chitin deacetylase (PgdA/CDA1 family)